MLEFLLNHLQFILWKEYQDVETELLYFDRGRLENSGFTYHFSSIDLMYLLRHTDNSSFEIKLLSNSQ